MKWSVTKQNHFYYCFAINQYHQYPNNTATMKFYYILLLLCSNTKSDDSQLKEWNRGNISSRGNNIEEVAVMMKNCQTKISPSCSPFGFLITEETMPDFNDLLSKKISEQMAYRDAILKAGWLSFWIFYIVYSTLKLYILKRKIQREGILPIYLV